METELIDAVMEGAPSLGERQKLNRFQAKVMRYLTTLPTTSDRMLAVIELTKHGFFVPGLDYEESKFVFDKYSQWVEDNGMYCEDGRQRFRDAVRTDQPKPQPKPQPNWTWDYKDDCFCERCCQRRADIAEERGY